MPRSRVTGQISTDSPGSHRQVETRRLNDELRIALTQCIEQPVCRQRALVLGWRGSRPVCTMWQRPAQQRHVVPVEKLRQPFPHVHHRSVNRQVEHLPRHPIVLEGQ
jgi:hypothetical protein